MQGWQGGVLTISTQDQGAEAQQNSAVALHGQEAPPPPLNRGLEPRRTFFRCGRYFTVGNDWYATARGGREIGPFATRDEAEIALARHVTACFIRSSGHIGQLDAHGRRDATVLEVLVQELASCWEQARMRSENSAYAWAKQRLEAIEAHPEDFTYPNVRPRALRQFLTDLGH